MNAPPSQKPFASIIVCAAIPLLAVWFTFGPLLKEGFGGLRGFYFFIEFACIAAATYGFHKRRAPALLMAVTASAYIASVITYAAINEYLGKNFHESGDLSIVLFLLPFHLPFALAGTVTAALVLLGRRFPHLSAKLHL